MQIDRYFFSIFGGAFNSDVIDHGDPNYFNEQAQFIVVDIIKVVKDLDLLILQLTEILEKWTPELVMPFIDSTNFNWYDSPELEQILKEVIQTIIFEIQKYQINLKET